MQARNFIDSFFLYVAKNDEKLSSILSDQLPSAASKNGVILYPNPNSHRGSSSNGACDYRARVIIEGQEHKDVSIGNQLLLEKGFLTVKSDNHYGKLIGVALEKANVQQATTEPAQLACEDTYDASRAQDAREVKQKGAENQSMQEEVEADAPLIHYLMTNWVTEREKNSEKKSVTYSHIVHKNADYHPNAEEVAPNFLLPFDLANIVFDYLAKGVDDRHLSLNKPHCAHCSPKTVIDNYNFPNMPTVSQCAQYSLFGRSYLSEQKTAEMTRLGSMVLSGEEEDVETVLREVKKNPELLDIVITAPDPLGAPITGTLLQLAAMAGDFDLQFYYAPYIIVDEKYRGLVERLIIAGNIPEEKVLKQLECINSEDAKRENDARIQRYVEIIQLFENSNPDLKTIAIELCKERRKAVNAGFIFDPRILIRGLLICYKGSINDMVFLTVVLGGLQCLLSSRDAQAIVAGIDNCKYRMPKRTLKYTSFNPRNPRYFPDARQYLRLGGDYYLGVQGEIIRNYPSIDRANFLLLLDELKLHLETFLKQKEANITYLTSGKEKSALSKCIKGCSLM